MLDAMAEYDRLSLPDVPRNKSCMATRVPSSNSIHSNGVNGAEVGPCRHMPSGNMVSVSVLPAMLEALGITPRPLQTAAVVVAHLTPDGQTVAVEWHKPRL